ncbi:MAG TPA: ABC transporter permease [Candidatus Acidoferrum sp.]|jgi:predicted permease
MSGFWNDLRFALRAFGKHPAFAIIAIVTLGLGMAVNTTVFSVVNGFLLRPMPVPHPEQITVLALQQQGQTGLDNFSYPDFQDLRQQSASVGELFAYNTTLVGLNADGKGDHCIVSRVTNNYFSAMGVNPEVGRFILSTEGLTPGADPIVVLGYSYWQKRFAGDRNIAGKHVEVNGHAATIVGVMPKGFYGAYSMIDMDAYVPLSANFSDEQSTSIQDVWTKREIRSLTVLARLKSGVTVPQAQTSLNVVAQRIAQQYPQTDQGITVRAFPERQARPQPDVDNSLALASATFILLAGLVLLVACFNIANVLLVRATVRQREMAIRAAMGAGRARLVRQYLTESLLLAVLGGGAGLTVASWVAGLLSTMSWGTSLPIKFNFYPDGRVYLFALLAVLLTGFIVGVIPALRVGRTDVSLVLHEGGRGSSDGGRRRFVRNSLVVAQVAGSLVLLIVAGLFVRSLNKAQSIYLGFNPDHVLNLSLDVDSLGYKEARGREFFRDLDARIRKLPGVISQAEAFTVPLGYVSAVDTVNVPEHPVEPGKQPPGVGENFVSPEYFDTLNISLLRGRVFSEADTEKSPQVAVISQAMAAKFWPTEDALGRHFTIKNENKPIEVIGIVQDGKYRDITEQPQPYIYLPLAQSYVPMRVLYVRTSVPPESLALSVQEQIRELAPGLPVTEVQTMSKSLQGANGFFFYRFGAQLTAVMGLLGLILAIVGIYSVGSYVAAQRTQEIGIRMALGAAPPDILKMILRQGLGVIAIGLVLGLAIAFAGTRVLAGMFVGIKPTDPVTFVAVVAVLSAIALIASWIPARRATRVDPLVALRYE